jgi:hypothetical protein
VRKGSQNPMNEVKRLEEVIDSYLEDSKLTQEEILRIL